MPLELRKKPDGTIRKWWYGRYEVNGKRYCDNLGVKITGTPPASLSLTVNTDVTNRGPRIEGEMCLRI